MDTPKQNQQLNVQTASDDTLHVALELTWTLNPQLHLTITEELDRRKIYPSPLIRSHFLPLSKTQAEDHGIQ